jgi:hypothetical protein
MEYQTLTKSILRKWRSQGVFYRFLDYDKSNTSAKNLKQVTLKEALAHINDWVCDWDLELTDPEVALVHSSLWRSQVIFH